MVIPTRTDPSRLVPAPCAPPPRSRSFSGIFVLVLICTTAAFGAGALSCERDGPKAEVIPGTERIKSGGNAPWFTISPDERWLAFMEVDSTDWAPQAPIDFHLVSMEIATGMKTHHDLAGMPQRLYRSTSIKTKDYWKDVRVWWEEAAWYDGRMYVEMKGNMSNPTWIAFTPGVPSPEVTEPPPSLSCSGCSPPRELMEYARARGLREHQELTAAYQDGAFSRVVYAEKFVRDSDEAIVERVEADGTGTRVFEDRRAFREIGVMDLLVSPDERYLAIVLWSNLKSPIPLPTLVDELVILELQSGKRSLVKRTFVIGTLMWSADSKRLYFAAVNEGLADGFRDGVYVVSMPQ